MWLILLGLVLLVAFVLYHTVWIVATVLLLGASTQLWILGGFWNSLWAIVMWILAIAIFAVREYK